MPQRRGLPGRGLQRTLPPERRRRWLEAGVQRVPGRWCSSGPARTGRGESRVRRPGGSGPTGRCSPGPRRTTTPEGRPNPRDHRGPWTSPGLVGRRAGPRPRSRGPVTFGGRHQRGPAAGPPGFRRPTPATAPPPRARRPPSPFAARPTPSPPAAVPGRGRSPGRSRRSRR
jgi:hypothetical protein